MTLKKRQMIRKKIGVLLGILFLGIVGTLGTFWLKHSSVPLADGEEPPFVNVYNWYDMIPQAVIKQFQEETGIHVRYDLYDNNEVLEAKLLAGHSGYDVVFPSVAPYVARQIAAKAYQPLQKNLLPNCQYLDPQVIAYMKEIDPKLTYAIPYYWGTLGIAYVEEEVKKRMPNAPVNSYRMLFDPDIIKQFKTCGVTFLEEPVDIFPLVLKYMGLNKHPPSAEDIKKATKHLLKIRPSIARFSSSRFVNDLMTGESCVAQAWSGDAQRAQEATEGMEGLPQKRTIRYVIPQEGTTIWIDAMAIPVHAPHPKNAHRFINFLLRPDIAAKVTNAIQLPTAVKASHPWVRKDILQNPSLYPPADLLAKSSLDKELPQEIEREMSKAWTIVKRGTE